MAVCRLAGRMKGGQDSPPWADGVSGSFCTAEGGRGAQGKGWHSERGKQRCREGGGTAPPVSPGKVHAGNRNARGGFQLFAVMVVLLVVCECVCA